MKAFFLRIAPAWLAMATVTLGAPPAQAQLNLPVTPVPTTPVPATPVPTTVPSAPVPTVPPSQFVTFRAYATVYAPNTPGSVEVAVPDRCAKFASLAQSGNLANSNCPAGYRIGMDWRVRVTYNNQAALIPVKDVGPWNEDDNWWNPSFPSHPRARRTFQSLPQGKPAAEAAFTDGFNRRDNCLTLDYQPSGRAGGADQFGRCVLNPAGIDLSFEAARQIGMVGSQWVTVSFLWEPARGGYVLDGYGGVHPYNGAPPVTGRGWWPGWDIARGIVTRPDGRSGYVVDGWGAVFPFGTNLAAVPPPNATGYFVGRDIVRGMALDPADTGGSKGYVVDGQGGIHPFGGAPGVFGNGWFPGSDIVKGIVVNPRTIAFPYVTGYVLDGFGRLHPFAEIGRPLPPAPAGAASWDWDIARAFVLTGFGQGYTLSGWGSIHPFGGVPAATGGLWLPNRDIFRGITWDPIVGGGYVLGGLGGVYPYNAAPAPETTASFSFDIANAIGG